MANELLVRAYNVGCGDCLYVRIPKGADDRYHILIDCGTKGSDPILKDAIDHLVAHELPDAGGGKKRLDLLIATHRHEDHIKGFNAKWFKNITVKHIWLSAVMNPDHPQAGRVNALHSFAKAEMRGLLENGRALSPDLAALAALYGVSNDAADKLLMEELPEANGIMPKYVHAGQTGQDLGFDTGPTKLHILGPEKDIDGYYLGEDADESLRTLTAMAAKFREESEAVADALPRNVSAVDFRNLQARMISNGLGFAEKDTKIQNNLSVVLLIEWRGRRLLFVGDAEWEGEFKEGKHNGSWNVMWAKRKALLNKPLDFLKIGHHGSINATPPPRDDSQTTALYEILDAILPRPKGNKKPTAQAIVSTEREFYPPIPESELMVELGRRVANVRNYRKLLEDGGIAENSIWVTTKAKKHKYFEKYEKDFLGEPQPCRTDLEFLLDSDKNYVDVLIPPNT